jgi:hypothetical protein
MQLFKELWLAILAAGAATWIASALSWMVVGHHKKDWDRLPDEDRALDKLRELGLPPGVYGFPFIGSHKESSTEAAKEKWAKGPLGLLRIWGPVNMGKNMVLTAVFFFVVSGLIGYLGSACLPRGAEFWKVFQVLGTAGVLAYSASTIPGDIWFQNKVRATFMHVVDGIAFGLITGAVFAALWPK